MCPPKRFIIIFSRLANFFYCFKWEHIFHAEHSGVFFLAPRVKECSTLGKTWHSSLSLFSQLTNHSGGGAGLIHHTLLVLRLNNNGEVNIACLRVFMSLPDGIAGVP